MTLHDFTTIEHFTFAEVAKVSDDISKVSPLLLSMLDDARCLAGIPFRLTSVHRSYATEIRAGRSGQSSHVRGLAADIACSDSRSRYLMLDALLRTGFDRIGISSTFIHVDIDHTKDPKVAWLY